MAMALFRAMGSHCSSVIARRFFPCSAASACAYGDQIFAGIKAGGNFTNVRSQSFLVAQEGRARDRINLGAGIVDVVFLADIIASHFQQRRQGIAKHGAATMADMQWPGRICRDILNICLDALAQFRTAVVVTRPQELPSRIFGQKVSLRRRLMKPGPATSADKTSVLLCQPFGQSIRQNSWRHAGGFGHHHGRVGRHIAMGSIARRFRRHPGNIKAGRQFARCHHGRKLAVLRRFESVQKGSFHHSKLLKLCNLLTTGKAGRGQTNACADPVQNDRSCRRENRRPGGHSGCDHVAGFRGRASPRARARHHSCRPRTSRG